MRIDFAVTMIIGFMIGTCAGIYTGINLSSDRVKCINGVEYNYAGNGVYVSSESSCIAIGTKP